VSWAQETSLDLDMVSAACPTCRLLLVEADSDQISDLAAAANTAAAQGAEAVGNSYGLSEFRGETGLEPNYAHPGVTMTASTGDKGYGVRYPAASAHVTSVGGTTLTRDGSPRGWSETAWPGGGSGCSAYIPKPPWQSDPCPRRMVADVSAVADPSTGANVYDSFGSTGGANWYVFGGTSLAAAFVAGVYGLAGHGATDAAANAYAHREALFDVVSGSNGRCGNRRKRYRCNAVPGYDGPTGLGTPNGITAF
jgi:subtilase family serine protease